MEKDLLADLYGRYYQELFLYVYSMNGRTSLTEDIVQETFLKALTSLKDSHTNMRAWLYLTAHNLCINLLKREQWIYSAEPDRKDVIKNDEPELTNQKQTEMVYEDVLDEVLRREKKRELFNALFQISEMKREVLALQYFGGFGQKEIAAMLHLTPENVRVLSFRAKKELRHLLEEE